ncbi:site-2 protease family protein [Myxococcota bacterium]
MLNHDPSPRLPTTATERRIVAVSAVVLFGLFAAEIGHAFTAVKLSAVWIALFWVPLLVLHEVGHALAARWVGWRISEVVIGFGPEVIRFRAGACRVRVRASPLEGYVAPSPASLRAARGKSAFVYAAGPGAELLLVGLLWLWLGEELTQASQATGVIVAQSLAVAALMGALFNLVPFPTAGGMSDGLGILVSLWAGDEMFRHRLTQPFVREAHWALYAERPGRAAEWIERGLRAYPEDPQLQALRAVCSAAAGNQSLALEQLRNLGHPNDHPPAVQTELLLDGAWIVLWGPDSSLLEEASQACHQVLSLQPASVRAHLLLGRVQYELQRDEAALQLLLAGYKLARDAEEEGQFVAYLALTCRRLGHHDLAGRFMAAVPGAALGPALRRSVERE